jgi:hypothetical protein
MIASRRLRQEHRINSGEFRLGPDSLGARILIGLAAK